MTSPTLTTETMKQIMECDYLNKHPDIKKPALYYDRIEIGFNQDAKIFEARMFHGKHHVATIAIGGSIDFARGDVVVLNDIQGFMHVNLTD